MFLTENTDYTVMAFKLLLPLAIILCLSKLLQMCCKKIKLPAVVGMLVTGIIIGLLNYLPDGNFLKNSILSDDALHGLKFLAEIGVVLIMFSAGLGTNLQSIKKSGLSAIVVTALGVLVPMGLGFLVACLFNGFSDIYSSLFYGVILTATSVSVTVATLKELGRLQGKAGTIIVSAAILDDIIGVVVLSVILSLSGNGSGTVAASDPTIGSLLTGQSADLSILAVILNVILFFIFIVVVGLLMHKLFDALNRKFSHTHKLPIFGIALAFFMAWASEKWFGVADITGAYFAGLALSGMGHYINPARHALKDDGADYIESKSDVLSYMLFSPVFFANVGINTNFSGLDVAMLGFGACYILAGLFGKVIGCGLGAKLTKQSWKNSLRIGVGMMARAEVALICTTKGVEAGLIDPGMSAFVVVMIIVSSFATPLILKLTYKAEKPVKQDYATEIFTATHDHTIAEASSQNYNTDSVEP